VGPAPRRPGGLARGLETAALVAAVAALVVIVAAMIAQVVFRYALNAPLQWSETISVYALVWVVFLGAAALSFGDGHVSIPSLTDRLPPAGRAVSAILVHLAMIGFAAVVVWLSWGWMLRGSHQMSASLGISTRWVKAALPLGVGLMGVAAAIRLAGDVAALWRRDMARFPRAHDGED
jgi:TRAP-type C4-dicarboxylate transport system permease small subunit